MVLIHCVLEDVHDPGMCIYRLSLTHLGSSINSSILSGSIIYNALYTADIFQCRYTSLVLYIRLCSPQASNNYNINKL